MNRIERTERQWVDVDGPADRPRVQLHEMNPAQYLVSLRDGTAPLAGNLTREVPVVALDALDLRRPVRFIKMDVEGAEPQVVRGAARILAEDRPIMLSELHPTQLDRASGVSAAEFLSQLAAIGYRAHRLRADGAVGDPIAEAPADAMVSVALLPRA